MHIDPISELHSQNGREFLHFLTTVNYSQNVGAKKGSTIYVQGHLQAKSILVTCNNYPKYPTWSHNLNDLEP